MKSQPFHNDGKKDEDGHTEQRPEPGTMGPTRGWGVLLFSSLCNPILLFDLFVSPLFCGKVGRMLRIAGGDEGRQY